FDPKADRYTSLKASMALHSDAIKDSVAKGDHHAATAMAVRGSRIALAYLRLNRLATDGTSGGFELRGPKTMIQVKRGGREATFGRWGTKLGKLGKVGPTSMDFSPDGKWLYLTGYHWKRYRDYTQSRLIWAHGVLRMKFEGDAKPELFAGSMTERGFGSDNAHFKMPASVACDSRGRVYVADYLNDRIQVYLPNGRFHKTVKANKPAQIAIHHETNELYVFSWYLRNDYLKRDFKVPARLTHLGPLEDPREIASYRLPLRGYQEKGRNLGGAYDGGGVQYRVALDSWAKEPTVWLVPKQPKITGFVWTHHEGYKPPWETAGILLLVPRDGKLVVKRDFGREAKRTALHLRHVLYLDRQRIYLNPKTGLLYVAGGLEPNGSGREKAFEQLLEIDPKTGKMREIALPFNAHDLCFDIEGRVYLQGFQHVVRYNFESWREIPWDYGVETSVGFARGHGKRAKAVSAIRYQGYNTNQGGIGVSLKGRLVISTTVPKEFKYGKRTDEKQALASTFGKKYLPRLYPGRILKAEKVKILHVWDKHGMPLYKDAVPGIGFVRTVRIDSDDNLYILNDATRVINGRLHFNDLSGTLMKFKPNKGRIFVKKGAPIPLPEEKRPKRPPDLKNYGQGAAWVEGAEWMRGGLGRFGQNYHRQCSCTAVNFALDYFGRSFAPEMDRYSVIVLDANGNPIVRLGTYGNVGDGRPLDPAGGPPNPRSIGGDEVALFIGSYLAVHTDRRLFIFDNGNARILSVRLDYHTTQKVALKNIPEGKLSSQRRVETREPRRN
ncbi:hypothetical protein LCGC14_1763490, partial [marine sediment metagenome]